MKKKSFFMILPFLFLIVFYRLSGAASVFKDFDEHVRTYSDKYLGALAKDTGAVLGGGMFHTASTCRFPGFDLSMRVVASGISDDNRFLKDADIDTGLMAFPWFQLDAGLLSDLDLIGRMFSYQSIKLWGVGIKYQFLSGLTWPALSLLGSINSLDYDLLEVRTYSINLILSSDFTSLTLYGGGGFDSTVLKSKVEGFQDLESRSCGWRMIAGLKKRFFMLFYLNGALTLSNNNLGGEIGTGISF